MTDVIQRNAANIVALSMLLFTKASAVTDCQPLAPIWVPLQDALRFHPCSDDVAPKLVTA
jgi:hypothetical protein